MRAGGFVAAGAALALTIPAAPAPAASPISRAACSMPRPFLERTDRGIHGKRSGDIQIVTRQPDFVGPG
ncbi:MAG: hypothetical protein ACRDH1_08475, partial [Actinomycetota bacterium]